MLSRAAAAALNRGYVHCVQIGAADAGLALVDYLSTRFRHSTRSTWAARLAEGQLTLDDRPATGDERLRAGQRVVWQRPPWREPDVPTTYAVVHADEALLVVAKPAGLPTLPAGGFLEHTLLAVVRREHGTVSPVHRLGRHTSGLVVFARSGEAAAALARAWHTDAVVKVYRALASGAPPWQRCQVTMPIGPVPHPRLGTVHAASPSGRPASSSLHVVERRPGATLCDVQIHTGRPHQIRIHAAAAGYPLVGDPLYAAGGVPMALAPGLPGDGGYFLHAHRLTLPHPTRGGALTLDADPPAILRLAE